MSPRLNIICRNPVKQYYTYFPKRNKEFKRRHSIFVWMYRHSLLLTVSHRPSCWQHLWYDAKVQQEADQLLIVFAIFLFLWIVWQLD